MGTLLQDLKYGLRMLVKNPGFTAVAVITLALGIGANAAVFTMLDAILWKPLPVQKPSELVRISTLDSRTGKSRGIPPNFLSAFQERNQVFSGVIADIPDGVSFRAGDTTERVIGDVVTANYYSVLGVKPYLGRFFSAGSDRADWEPVAVLSYDFFKRRFGADPSVVDRTVYLNGYPFTIIGVSPPGFFGLEVDTSWEVRVPMMMQPGMQQAVMPAMRLLDLRHEVFVYSVARLKRGVDRAQAEAATEVLLQQLCRSDPAASANQRYQSLHIHLEKASHGTSRLKEQFATPLVILMALVGLVLLIACANVANLMLARAMARQREIAVRRAVGASRAHLIQQFLIESLLLAVLSGSVGVAFSVWGANALVGFLPQGTIPIVLELKPDLRVLGFAFTLSSVVAVVLGLVPSLLVGEMTLVPALKGEAGWLGSGERPRVAAGIFTAVGQVALSLVLLVVVGLLLRTLRNLETTDPGFAADNLIMFSLKPIHGGNVRYTAELVNLYSGLLERVRAVPGVAGASLTAVGPFSGGMDRVSPITIDGQTTVMVSSVGGDVVTPGFFAMARIPVLRGRDFSPFDDHRTPRVVIVTEALARTLFGDEDPIGRKISISPLPGDQNLQIVGVVRNLRYDRLRDSSGLALFRPFAQVQSNNVSTLVVRVRVRDVSGVVAGIRREIHSLDKDLPVFNIRSAAAQMDRILARERLLACLSTVYGALALVLTFMGLYSIMAYAVTRRTNEIGIRMALGAQQEDILRMVLRETLVLAVIGVAIGIPVALAATQLASSLISGLLFGLKATDPVTLAVATSVMVGAALFAGYLPARRATKVDPMVALRYE